MQPSITFEFRVDADFSGARLDVFLAEQSDPPLSRSQVKKRIEDGEISVNQTVAKKAGVKLETDDLVVWDYAPPMIPDSLTAEDIPLDILFEDDHVAIVNKPAGMVVHPAPGHYTGTLVNALVHHFDKLPQIGGALRPGIVHRIDKDTSGALAVAKSDAAHQHLSNLFRNHDIERRYHALVHGPGLPDSGTFDTLHGRSPNDRKRYTGNVAEGRHAVTHFNVLERFQNGAALVECQLETGRTHQIRMHFFETNSPLLGDSVYAGKNVSTSRLISRQALHARTLGFTHVDGSDVFAQAPYPDDFASALEALRNGKDWRR